MATPRDQFELLCERCGYSIEGLPRETNCPECGRPVAASLPNARPGSPWQQSPGLAAWARTIAAHLAHPVRAMRAIRIEQAVAREFAHASIAAAALIALAVPTLFFLILPLFGFDSTLIARFREQKGDLPRPLMPIALWTCLVANLWLLTAIERLGIRFFGRVHRSRITPAVATSITSHATAGWVAGSVLVSAGFAVGLALHEFAMRHNTGALRGPFMLAPISLPVLGALAGLLWFETLVYAGVLNCRFANRVRPPGAQPGEPAPDTASPSHGGDPVAGAPGS